MERSRVAATPFFADWPEDELEAVATVAPARKGLAHLQWFRPAQVRRARPSCVGVCVGQKSEDPRVRYEVVRAGMEW
jgi:hypothetical protein